MPWKQILTLLLCTLGSAWAQTVQVSVGSTFPTTIVVDGTTFPGFPLQTFNWQVGSVHTLATTNNQQPQPGVQYVFTSWSDGGAISHPFTVTGAATVVANFKAQYQLTLPQTYGGLGLPNGSNFYDAGSVVNLSATAFYAFTFTGWTGTGLGSYTGPSASPSITMNAPITEIPNFVLVGLLGQNATAFGFTDPQGNIYQPGPIASKFFATGSRIAGTNTPYLYQNESFLSPSFAVPIQLPNGNYNLRLKFSEIYFNQAGQRKFNVAINGAPALTNFDIVSEAGASNTAVDKVFPIAVTNQNINVAFSPVISIPKLNAFSVTPAGVDLTVSPTLAVVTAGQSQQFNPTVIGTGNTAVNWTLSPAGVGAIDATGLYTAPALIPARQTVTVTATSQADPSKSASVLVKLGFPWQSQDIGSVNAPGTFTSQTQAYTVSGSGDLNGAADAYRFAWQPFNGNGSITARVNTMFNGQPVKAGVMMRDSTLPGSPYVMVSIFGGIVGLLQSRTALNGPTTVTFGAAGVYWVRLERVNATFTGYVSNDGVAWQQVGSAAVAMSSNALGGLAVSSGFAAPYSVVFDGVDFGGTTSVSVDQTLASMSLGQSAQFTATVTGAANPAVTWSVSPAGQGTITAGGLYTAPASLSAGFQSVTITATSVADPSQSSSVTVQLDAFHPIYVNAGGPTHIDPTGLYWQGDTGATLGTSYSNGGAIANTTTPYLYQSERFHTAAFTYSYIVPNGTYQVKLKFAEIFPPFTAPGQRVFNVVLNGNTVLPNFDIVASAGGQFKAIDRTFPVTVNNGLIQITFQPVVSAPQINAIQITF